MRWWTIYHIVMGIAMLVMAWDMWVAPHPTVTIGICSPE